MNAGPNRNLCYLGRNRSALIWNGQFVECVGCYLFPSLVASPPHPSSQWITRSTEWSDWEREVKHRGCEVSIDGQDCLIFFSISYRSVQWCSLDKTELFSNEETKWTLHFQVKQYRSSSGNPRKAGERFGASTWWGPRGQLAVVAADWTTEPQGRGLAWLLKALQRCCCFLCDILTGCRQGTGGLWVKFTKMTSRNFLTLRTNRNNIAVRFYLIKTQSVPNHLPRLAVFSTALAGPQWGELRPSFVERQNVNFL